MGRHVAADFPELDRLVDDACAAIGRDIEALNVPRLMGVVLGGGYGRGEGGAWAQSVDGRPSSAGCRPKSYRQPVPSLAVRVSTTSPSLSRCTVMLVGRLLASLFLSCHVFSPESSTYSSESLGIRRFVIVRPEMLVS